MPIVLRDNTETEDPRLGRLVHYDERSKDYPVTPLLAARTDIHATHPRVRSYRWRVQEWHNQGREGACVSYAHGHKVIGRPAESLKIFNDAYLYKIYRDAQLIDPWPETHEGGEDGTSVLAGAKIMQREGFYQEYRWIFGHDDGLRSSVLTLGYLGGLIMGTWWWSDMWNTDSRGFLKPSGQRVGGHAWYAYGIQARDAQGNPAHSMETLDLDKTTVFCRNSWGRGWGVNGDFKLTLRHFNFLRLDQGEAMFAVEGGGYFG